MDNATELEQIAYLLLGGATLSRRQIEIVEKARALLGIDDEKLARVILYLVAKERA